jgi:hypothetical protein
MGRLADELAAFRELYARKAARFGVGELTLEQQLEILAELQREHGNARKSVLAVRRKASRKAWAARKRMNSGRRQARGD